MPQVHMCAGPSGGQKRGSDTLELKLQEIISLLMWVGAGNSGPLQKQFTFLTLVRLSTPSSLNFKTRMREILDHLVKHTLILLPGATHLCHVVSSPLLFHFLNINSRSREDLYLAHLE